MRLTPKLKEILSVYESENPGVKTNLVRLLMQGKLEAPPVPEGGADHRHARVRCAHEIGGVAVFADVAGGIGELPRAGGANVGRAAVALQRVGMH